MYLPDAVTVQLRTRQCRGLFKPSGVREILEVDVTEL